MVLVDQERNVRMVSTVSLGVASSIHAQPNLLVVALVLSLFLTKLMIPYPYSSKELSNHYLMKELLLMLLCPILSKNKIKSKRFLNITSLYGMK